MDWLYRILAYIGVVLTAFCAGMVRGCTDERDRWETKSAQAQVEAQNETQRRIKAKDDLLNESRQREQKLATDRNRANDSVRLLREALASRSGNTPVAQGGKPDATTRELLGDCAERYQWMAGEADKANAAGSLCTSIYSALSNKQQVKNFIKEAK